MSSSTGIMKLKCVVTMAMCVGQETAKCAHKVRNSENYQFDTRYCICSPLEFVHCLHIETIPGQSHEVQFVRGIPVGVARETMGGSRELMGGFQNAYVNQSLA